MHRIANTSADFLSLPSGARPRMARRALNRWMTSPIERYLLMAVIVILPLQDHIPTIRGFSIMFILFVAMAGALFLIRPKAIYRTWNQPAFLGLYGFVSLCVILESFCANPDYLGVMRIGYMSVGAVLVASLCRDRAALKAALFAYLLMSAWLAAFLILNFYSALEMTNVTDLRQAGWVREDVLGESPLAANLNKLAFQTGQGVIVAVAFALSVPSLRRRLLFIGIALFGFVAVFVPMSRGGIVITVLSCAVVVLAYKAKRLRAIVIAGVLALGIFAWAPSAALTRLTSSMTSSYYKGTGDETDGRVRVLTAAIEHLPEYVMTGIGYGNFWDSWAVSRGVTVAHNTFLQVMIYWGLPALFGLLIVLWLAYRCVPKNSGADPLSLCVLGIAVSLVLRMLVSHNLADKDFALGLGILVGASLWVWPTRMISARVRMRFPRRRGTQGARPFIGNPSRLTQL